jgi:DNA-binding NarL/FixJ family response regulator
MTETSGFIRIVIADDHELFRDGLRCLLESEEAFKVVAEAADGLEAIETVRREAPDVLLLDLGMPGMGGVEALEALSADATKVVLLTAAVAHADILRAIRSGARGVVLKHTAARSLIDAIYAVMDGKYVVPGEAADGAPRAVSIVNRAARPFGLTKRELEIVRATAAGSSNRDMASRFDISVPTVKHHLSNIFEKTGVSSRLELATFAIQHGLDRL